MRNRRMVAAVLLLAVMGLVFPSASEAMIDRGALEIDGPDLMERLGRVWAWVQGVLESVARQFVTSEGAGVTTGG